VGTSERRRRAVAAALKTPGVTDVVDAIGVVVSGARTEPDAALARDLRQALAYDSFTPDERIRTVVSNGWITLHGALSRAALVRLVAANRYGLHAMHEEPFGMAVAEMVRGGCIVWVPRSGGQVEIVGGHPRLTYATREEAVASILRTLADPAEQAALRAHLAARRDLLSAERFMREIRDTVARFPAA
jgi:hypothetical protein